VVCGVYYPNFRSFGVFAYGDRYVLVFGNFLKRCFYSFGRGDYEVVASYVFCPLMLCGIVGRHGLILYWSEVTIAAISSLWWC
jgi:hypothetical protein